MKLNDKVNYNGHRLDGKDHGDTTITRRIESGVVTKMSERNCYTCANKDKNDPTSPCNQCSHIKRLDLWEPIEEHQ